MILDPVRSFGGELDSVAIYDRALTTGEISGSSSFPGNTATGSVTVTVKSSIVVDTTSDVADGDTSSIGALYANMEQTVRFRFVKHFWLQTTPQMCLLGLTGLNSTSQMRW